MKVINAITNHMTHRTEQCCKECSGWEPALHECSCQCHYATDESVVETRKRLIDELDLDCTEYTPDQGMPSPIWHVNDAQFDYIIESLLTSKDAQHKAEVRERITTYVNKKFLEGVVIDPLELYETLTNKES